MNIEEFQDISDTAHPSNALQTVNILGAVLDEHFGVEGVRTHIRTHLRMHASDSPLSSTVDCRESEGGGIC